MNLLLITCIINLLGAYFFYRKKKISDIIISPSVLTTLFILFYCILGTQLFWQGVYVYLEEDFELFIDRTFITLGLFVTIFFLTELFTYSFIKIKKNPIFYFIILK